jgi:signal peptidase II|tara:strand:+ start:76 stop:579 length:504 start_codon:yes stop_codon:yes gene_type:complete
MNFSLAIINKIRSCIKTENLTFIFSIAVIFVLDRYSKIEILDNFNEEIFYINDFININLVWNTGIGFGLLNSTSNFFYSIVSIFIALIILILFYVAFKGDKYEKIIFSIIIGGALGNVYDRIFLNAVPDFIDLHYKNFHWFTFNVADIFITLGIIAFLMKDFFIKKQ